MKLMPLLAENLQVHNEVGTVRIVMRKNLHMITLKLSIVNLIRLLICQLLVQEIMMMIPQVLHQASQRFYLQYWVLPTLIQNAIRV